MDLGCGTGRFTSALADTFNCPVIGIDPSEAMLHIAQQQDDVRISWLHGAAERLPLESGSIDLVFMCQVFHHLADSQIAIKEIHRVLRSPGYLIVRNGTEECNEHIPWLSYFPEAQAIERQRIPSRKGLIDNVCTHELRFVSQKTIDQYFAASYEEYFEKIRQRGLSALIAISDEAFEAGLARLKNWIGMQPRDLPVYEPVDHFTFCK
jgi:ubiquinone/menaquinone biosynthesis C-methylase UbiE